MKTDCADTIFIHPRNPSSSAQSAVEKPAVQELPVGKQVLPGTDLNLLQLNQKEDSSSGTWPALATA